MSIEHGGDDGDEDLDDDGGRLAGKVAMIAMRSIVRVKLIRRINVTVTYW